MLRAIVISIAADLETFACETEDGDCAVWRQHGGPALQAGDILTCAEPLPQAARLDHPAGVCEVALEAGPVSRSAALERVRGSGTGSAS